MQKLPNPWTWLVGMLPGGGSRPATKHRRVPRPRPTRPPTSLTTPVTWWPGPACWGAAGVVMLGEWTSSPWRMMTVRRRGRTVAHRYTSCHQRGTTAPSIVLEWVDDQFCQKSAHSYQPCSLKRGLLLFYPLFFVHFMYFFIRSFFSILLTWLCFLTMSSPTRIRPPSSSTSSQMHINKASSAVKKIRQIVFRSESIIMSMCYNIYNKCQIEQNFIKCYGKSQEKEEHENASCFCFLLFV